MEREELVTKLRRLLGDEGLEEAVVDLAALERHSELPEWLARLARAAEALPLPEGPPVVTQDIKRLFDASSLIESQEATLVSDTRFQRDLVGVRGADGVEGWSMTYTSEMADVVLDVWPQDDGTVSLDGQVMAHGAAASAYRAKVNGPSSTSVSGDRLGRFHVESLLPGPYSVIVDNGRIELELRADLGDPEE